MEKRKIGMQKKRSQHVHKIELRIKTTLLGLSVDASTPSPLVCCLRCLSVPCPSWGSCLSFPSHFWRLVLGCIEASDSESRRIFHDFSRSTRFSPLRTAPNQKFQQKTCQKFTEISESFAKFRSNFAKFLSKFGQISTKFHQNFTTISENLPFPLLNPDTSLDLRRSP